MNTIADFTFGINHQALAVLHMLNREPDFADYRDGFYKVQFHTRPWYNGRERGVVISMSKRYGGKDDPVLHIAFFEHRNSDEICALKWQTERHYWNHPVEDPEIFNVAYGGKDKNKFDVAYSVHYGETGKMAQWIYEQFAAFYGPKEEKKAETN